MGKLELKHIAPYLPYGLRMQNEFGDIWIANSAILYTCKQTGIMYLKTNSLPILRPISDLTKEIDINGEMTVPCDRLGYEFNMNVIEYNVILSNLDNMHFVLRCSSFIVIQKLIEWHFDVFGLIDQGLAIDINTLESEATND